MYYFIHVNLSLYLFQIVYELFSMLFVSKSKGNLLGISNTIFAILFQLHVFVTAWGIRFVWSARYLDLMNSRQRLKNHEFVFDKSFDSIVQSLIWVRLGHISLLFTFTLIMSLRIVYRNHTQSRNSI